MGQKIVHLRWKEREDAGRLHNYVPSHNGKLMIIACGRQKNVIRRIQATRYQLLDFVIWFDQNAKKQ